MRHGLGSLHLQQEPPLVAAGDAGDAARLADDTEIGRRLALAVKAITDEASAFAGRCLLLYRAPDHEANVIRVRPVRPQAGDG